MIPGNLSSCFTAVQSISVRGGVTTNSTFMDPSLVSSFFSFLWFRASLGCFLFYIVLPFLEGSHVDARDDSGQICVSPRPFGTAKGAKIFLRTCLDFFAPNTPKTKKNPATAGLHLGRAHTHLRTAAQFHRASKILPNGLVAERATGYSTAHLA